MPLRSLARQWVYCYEESYCIKQMLSCLGPEVFVNLSDLKVVLIKLFRDYAC